MRAYTWEIQRNIHGWWSHQDTRDPRGHDRSELNPEAFAQNIADTHPVDGSHRVVVWDTPGVGRPPAAVLTRN